MQGGVDDTVLVNRALLSVPGSQHKLCLEIAYKVDLIVKILRDVLGMVGPAPRGALTPGQSLF